MPDDHGLPGSVALRVIDVAPQVARALAAEFGGAPPPRQPVATVTVRGAERARREGPPPCRAWTGDGGDGRMVGLSEAGLVVVDRDGWFEVGGSMDATDVRLDRARPGWAVASGLVRPALQLVGLERGVAVVHAASVAIDGKAVLLAGWSESGKTETALALAEEGALFVGDKWTVLAPPSGADGSTGDQARAAGGSVAAPFPGRVGIRDWVVPYLPRLAAGLGRGQRTRLRGGTVAARLGRAASAIGRAHPAASALSQPVAQMSSLAATIRLSAADVRAMYDQAHPEPDLPLGAVVVLTTIDARSQAGIEPTDPARQAAHLARSAAYERRSYHLLGERGAALGHSAVPGFGIGELEAAVLRERFSAAPVLEVRVPFPADPTVAAGLIRGAL